MNVKLTSVVQPGAKCDCGWQFPAKLSCLMVGVAFPGPPTAQPVFLVTCPNKKCGATFPAATTDVSVVG